MTYLVTALPQILTQYLLLCGSRAGLPFIWVRAILGAWAGMSQNSDNAVTRQQHGGRS